MRNINKILNEKIKAEILEKLMKKELSFSEILKEVKLTDHGQLNYHIKTMISEGLIEKSNERYRKTPLGERMGVYLNQFQSKEMYPLSVVIAIVKNEKGEILLLKRAKSPQKRKWSFPGGKITLGEKISETAERELFEETGIRAKFDSVLGLFPSLVYSGNELSFHVNLIPVLMKRVSSKDKITLNQDEHNDFRFVNMKDINQYPIIANNLNILAKIKEGKFYFEESVFKE